MCYKNVPGVYAPGLCYLKPSYLVNLHHSQSSS